MTDIQTLALDPAADLDQLLANAGADYAVHFETVRIGEQSFEILQLTDMDAYVDRLAAQLPPGMPLELPFWAKLWRTSFLLSYFVQRLEPARPNGTPRSMLEIGAGVGLCGLAAAAQGFDVTITDIAPEALLFTRINILKNGLEERARVAHADFTSGDLGRRYDIVLGSEVLYMEDTYRPLIRFLLRHLKHDTAAEAVLAKEFSRKAKKFFTLADRDFRIRSMEIGFKASDEDTGAKAEKHLCSIYRLSPKKIAT